MSVNSSSTTQTYTLTINLLLPHLQRRLGTRFKLIPELLPPILFLLLTLCCHSRCLELLRLMKVMETLSPPRRNFFTVDFLVFVLETFDLYEFCTVVTDPLFRNTFRRSYKPKMSSVSFY